MLQQTIVIVVLAAAVASGASFHGNLKKLKPNGRIIGGDLAKIEDNPWQVSLEAFGLHNCGGSIIAPDTILTAAHCIDGILSYFYEIVAGTDDLNVGGTRISLKEAIVHENYTDLSNDVALIILKENLTFSDKIQPVKLADEELAPGTEVTVSGWGILHSWDLFTPNNLYSVNINIIDRDTCANNYNGIEGAAVDETMICAGVTGGGKDACSGDSGGPLTVDGIQYGIVSWGVGCAEADYPGVYTNVASVRSWIKKKTGI